MAKKQSAIYRTNSWEKHGIFSLVVDRFLSKWAAIVDIVNNFVVGDSLPSEVHLLKEGNVKPVKRAFNEEGLIIV